MESDSPKDFKDTLNLPSTEFPMKANLVKKEPEILAFWKDRGIYEKMLEKNRGGRRYVLHDGPPYANGHIHIGHALNKILKDVIVKYQSMAGAFAPYVPGWDCHGLPIELQVDKNLGSKKAETTIMQKRSLCRDYALKFIDLQREEFIRLGVFGNWQEPYITMDYGYQAAIVREFYEFLKKGYVYKGKKPVHWCSSCVTALAEAEVEYGDKQSPSIYVGFRIAPEDAGRIVDSPNAGGQNSNQNSNQNLYIVIWTTTPWTLPANLALAVNPEVEYAVVKDGGKDGEVSWIVALSLVDRLREAGVIGGTVVKTIMGGALEGVRAVHPFIDRRSQIVPAEFVTVEEGSGVVHIAPGHGEDDYKVGLKYGLDIYVPVDDYGKFIDLAELPEAIKGKFVFAANSVIIDILKEKGALLKQVDITHSYPHCWRCKKPVIFRATEQWFISMETGNLRESALEEIEKVKWVPHWGKDRINGMLKTRPDWCISRQRSWGVPIAVLSCKGCAAWVTDEAILDGIIGRVGQHGADLWFELSPGELLPAGYSCPKCGSENFGKETDILDVWFDSGVSHAAVLERFDGLSSPADMYLEGSDQHRGWFQSSLLTSTGIRDRAPFKSVLTHGFVVDGKGKKMSKSQGNVIAPQEIIGKSGAEILRLWVAAEDYRNDVRISKEILDRLTEAYRKIRNTLRFLLGNVSDFDGADYSPHLDDFDRYAMHGLQKLIGQVTRSYDNFNFHEVFHAIHNFCIVDMSSFYLDILKDKLYTFKTDSTQRRASQWSMRTIATTLTGLMAPIMSFTAEEIWQNIKDKDSGAESVFLTDFPAVDERFLDDSLETCMKTLISIREVANKALELKRQEKFIGNSLEACLSITPDEPGYALLREYEKSLPTLFIVSQVEILPPGSGEKPDEKLVAKPVENTGPAINAEANTEAGTSEATAAAVAVSITVKRAEGQKCKRCWNVSTTVGAFGDIPEVCGRCHAVLIQGTRLSDI
ncbi:MAG: isoleucine--tRNA ligase [Nitrospirae bacterium]|nr:isoleucine--tRNA ligase [Nitrospirota bacterium]